MTVDSPVFAAVRGWQVLDRSAVPVAGHIREETAAHEALAEAVGAGQAPPTALLWRHPGAFVMGYRDARLPGCAAGAAWLEGQGYQVAVRTSGGAGVPLDAGVLNVALVYPDLNLTMADGFAAMYQWVRAACLPLGIAAVRGLVPGGYCPGADDVGAAGRKFCGIAQRRKRLATAVHAFILAEGRGEDRGRLARGFYDRAAAGVDPGPPGKGAYPVVEPAAMASLAELAPDASVPALVETLLLALPR